MQGNPQCELSVFQPPSPRTCAATFKGQLGRPNPRVPENTEADDDKFSVEKPEATAHRHGAREERPDVEDVKDTSGPRTSGPCDRISTEDEPRCCKKDMDFDAQDICCTKQGGCFTKEDRKKETLAFAETEIVEAERKFETETLAEC